MKISKPYKTHRKGFSLVEVMIALAVLTILVLIAVATITKVKPAAEISKLRSDVQVLNTAIKVYKHSGGDLSTATAASEVIAKLKTIRDKKTASSFVGYTGSMIDTRTMLVQVNASANGPRAVYDNANNKFYVTTDNVAGFKIGLNLEEMPGANQTEETRAESALEYAEVSSWVWDYEDAPPPPRLDPTLVTRVDVTTPTPGGPGSVGNPTGPLAPVLEKLLPPEFSILSDYYDLGDFPMALTLTNPNDASRSKIIYGVVNAPNWSWEEYSGPINIGPGDKVLAFVESLKPQEYHHSDPADEHYNWTAGLDAPVISATEEEIDARTGATTITITHTNNPDYFQYGDRQLPIPGGAFILEYQLVPLESGQGSATDWTEYTNPFDVGGPQFPKGFEVVARVKANSPNFNDSSEASLTINTYYELEPPTITSNVETLESSSESATITLTNPNPPGSSQLVYQVLNEDGIPTTGWLNYSGPFPVSGAQFPRGFTVVGKSVPLEAYYRESGEEFKTVDVQFFGITVTGKTIFILDSSGSMSTNDRIGRLKTAAIGILNILDSGDSFAFIDYDSNATTLIPWGPGTDSRVAQATAAVNGMVAKGGTNYHKALAAGVALNTSEADQVIFLSDGHPNPPPGHIDEIYAYIDQFLAQGITRFDTVALGGTMAILGDMAARGNGAQSVVSD